MRKLLFILCAILLPPVAIGLYRGISGHFWLNLLLFVLTFGIGAMIHALCVVILTDERGALQH